MILFSHLSRNFGACHEFSTYVTLLGSLTRETVEAELAS